MQAVARPLDLARSGPWLGALLLIALVAFWPTYLAPRSFITSSGYTFGLTDLVLVGLIVLERHSRIGRWVFPAMLALFVATQAPALLALTETQPWQEFAR